MFGVLPLGLVSGGMGQRLTHDQISGCVRGRRDRRRLG